MGLGDWRWIWLLMVVWVGSMSKGGFLWWLVQWGLVIEGGVSGFGAWRWLLPKILVSGFYHDWVRFLKRGAAGLGFWLRGWGLWFSDAKIVYSDWCCLVVFVVVQCLWLALKVGQWCCKRQVSCCYGKGGEKEVAVLLWKWWEKRKKYLFIFREKNNT